MLCPIWLDIVGVVVGGLAGQVWIQAEVHSCGNDDCLTVGFPVGYSLWLAIAPVGELASVLVFPSLLDYIAGGIREMVACHS